MTDVPPDSLPESPPAEQPVEPPPARSLGAAIFKQLEIAINRFSEHRLTDWAAAMTYYSMLSIFPGLLVLVSLLGIVGQSATGALIGNFEELAPNEVRDVLVSAIRGLEQSGSTAGVVLVVGLVTAVYSASSYIGAYIRAAGIVLEVPERREFYKTIPLRLGITVLLMLLMLIVGAAIILTGPVAEEFSRVTGIGDDGISGWGLFKWPVVIALIVLVLAILYNLGPDYEHRRFRLITPGIALAVALWLLLSFGFSLYVGNFARYNKVYGSLAGVVIFLVWLWLSNMAVLLGLEFDSELKRFKRVHGCSAFSRQRRQRDRNAEELN